MRDTDTGLKWLTAEQLTAVLAQVPPGCRIAANSAGNLTVLSPDGEDYVGFVDFAEPAGAFELST